MECDPFDIWRMRHDPGVFFCLSGPISQDLLVEVCDTVVRRMKQAHTDTTTVMKVHAVVVELSQNIIRYSAQRALDPDAGDGGPELGTGVIAVGCRQGLYSVSSGNLVEDSRIQPLRELLEHIGQLDSEQLRTLFLERRRQPSTSRRGAGLGFIDVARKASRPLEYAIHPMEAGHAFFSIRVTV